MLYRSMFPRDLFAEMDRLQRAVAQNFGNSPSIRGVSGAYPAMNVGASARAVEIYAFAPGLDPAAIEVQIENGVLSVAGERKAEKLAPGATLHIDERFAGRFRRVVSLPEDVDPNAVSASYRDGLLHVSVARKASAQPRRIAIQ